MCGAIVADQHSPTHTKCDAEDEGLGSGATGQLSSCLKPASHGRLFDGLTDLMENQTIVCDFEESDGI